jgi:hypothetical protein
MGRGARQVINCIPKHHLVPVSKPPKLVSWSTTPYRTGTSPNPLSSLAVTCPFIITKHPGTPDDNQTCESRQIANPISAFCVFWFWFFFLRVRVTSAVPIPIEEVVLGSHRQGTKKRKNQVPPHPFCRKRVGIGIRHRPTPLFSFVAAVKRRRRCGLYTDIYTLLPLRAG